MKKDCLWARRYMNEFLDDRINQRRRKKFLIHIDECEECRREFKALEATRNLLMEAESQEPPKNFTEATISRLMEEKRKLGRRKKIRRVNWLDYIVMPQTAAVVMLVITTAFLFYHMADRNDSLFETNSIPAVSTNEETGVREQRPGEKSEDEGRQISEENGVQRVKDRMDGKQFAKSEKKSRHEASYHEEFKAAEKPAARPNEISGGVDERRLGRGISDEIDLKEMDAMMEKPQEEEAPTWTLRTASQVKKGAEKQDAALINRLQAIEFPDFVNEDTFVDMEIYLAGDEKLLSVRILESGSPRLSKYVDGWMNVMMEQDEKTQKHRADKNLERLFVRIYFVAEPETVEIKIKDRFSSEQREPEFPKRSKSDGQETRNTTEDR